MWTRGNGAGRLRPWQLSLVALLLAGCATQSSGSSSAPEDWRTWKTKRRESVAGTNGWATIVGLHWLSEGRHPVGPGKDDAIPIDTVTALGEFERKGTNVWFQPAPGRAVEVDGRSVAARIQLVPDSPGPATKFSYGNYQLWLIERGGRWGIRISDQAAPARRNFRGISYFPWQAEWQVAARFEPHPGGKTLPITDVTGVTKFESNPGAISFQHNGLSYRLEALADDEAGDLFILFQDATNGNTTYAPGRFLHASYPDACGQISLDFNRAYNPPCAFTEFATCPRPPKGNRLPFSIPAGEKKY